MCRQLAVLAVFASLFVASACWAGTAPNRQVIDGVAAGTIREAKASAWGFDPEDATAQLQAAIRSGVPRLIVDKMPGPWIVTPLSLVSNQEITFEKGVEVVARRGAFQKRNDILFSAVGCENLSLIGYGATWRMWREDYDNPALYQRGDWRHCLLLGACTNVKVYGLTLTGSGGDGIYIGSGSAGAPCRNVHIKDVTCDQNYRQGISVINAENLLIEKTILRGTSGSAPMAGIDFEPNRAGERLVNCVMRDCQFSGNAGNGILLALRNMGATSPDISLAFENCTSSGDRGSVWVDLSGSIEETPNGTIDFVNCIFRDARGPAVSVTKPAARVRTRFINCRIISPESGDKNATPIELASRQDATAPAGGIDFVDCVVTDPGQRPPIHYLNAGSVVLEAITGTLILDRNGRRETVPLNAETLAKWTPVTASRSIPRVSLEGLKLQPRVPHADPASRAFPHARARYDGHWILYAAAGDQVRVVCHHGQVGKYNGSGLPVTVTGPSGKQVCRVVVPFMQDGEVTFEAAETGLYRLDGTPGANSLSVVGSSHPLCMNGEKGPLRLTASPGDYYFWVPAGTREFAVRVSGEGDGEGVRALLINQNGAVVAQVDNSAWTHQFEVTLPAGIAGQAWLLRLARPSAMPLDDHHVDLRGVPPLLAPTAESLLIPAP